MMTRYGPLARLADWYHGVRDGLAKIPGRPPAIAQPAGADDSRPAALRTLPRWRLATTAHREYLIRMAQDAFEHEHIAYEAGLAAAAERTRVAHTRCHGTEETMAIAAAELAEASQPLATEGAVERGLGEARHSERVIRRRRQRQWRRRLDVAKKRHESARLGKLAADAELAAAQSQETSHRQVARARVGRIQEHFERRIASYRRALVRLHPDGAWANHVLGVPDPTIPAWLNNGITPEVSISFPFGDPPPADDQPVDRVVPPIPLAGVTTFGSASTADGHVHVDYYYAAPKHFEIRRRGDSFLLVEFGHGYGPFIAGQQVRRARLLDGSEFDFGGDRYRLSVSADGTALLFVTPLGACDLIVHDMSAVTGHQVRLTRMSVIQRAGAAMAILGPSGAGKTSLFFGLMNELTPSEGSRFFFRGLDVTRSGEQIRTMLGFVPQTDDLHRTLTVRRLLTYSDRLHRRDSRRGRAARITKVCAQLRVDDRIDRLVGSLSGGQLKRVSIALELLRTPELLMLDEPTSGLDAGMDREVMKLLNGYAAGKNGDGSDARLVIVITHTTTNLNQARQLLVLATGGRPVYAGSPQDLLPTLEQGSYADVMDMLTSNDRTQTETVAGLAEEYQGGQMAAQARLEADRASAEIATLVQPLILRAWGTARRFQRQLPTLIQRQAHLLLARGSSKNRSDRRLRDRITTPIKAALPLLIASGGAAIAAVVAKDDGLGPGRSAPGTLGLLTTLCMLAGQSLTYADIVSELPVIRRERRTGAVTVAVLVSKWLVFAVLAIVQAALVTVIFVAIRPGPTGSHRFSPNVELFVNLAALTVAAMTLGMLISSMASKVEQAVNWSTFLAIGQIALNGATADLSGTPAGWVAAAALPSRWGLAAASSSIDLRTISPGAPADALWTHSALQWGTDLAWLGLLTAAYFVLSLVWLRRKLSRPD